MPQTIALSESALALLRRRLGRERVEVTDATRPAFRELAEAGLMIPLHTMTGGDESAYRLTEAGVTFPSIRRSTFMASIFGPLALPRGGLTNRTTVRYINGGGFRTPAVRDRE